jgi:DNA-directed RNA polymerase alpha subunit
MIKILSKTPEKIEFISDMGISLANALRRSLYEVPVLAIDEVDIYRNDSALYDEVVAHRLGLVPLKNQKLKAGEVIELKLNVEGREVLSQDLGKEILICRLYCLMENRDLKLLLKQEWESEKNTPNLSRGLFITDT